FAADVSHELKNPLTSLRSAAETFPLAKTKDQRDRLLGVILHDVRRLDRLISDISDASRLDAELARQSAETVDMVRLLTTVVDVAREMASKVHPSLKLTLKLDEQADMKVLGNDSRLGQVINNLIDNACSFTGPDGGVRVSAINQDKSIIITVEDDGPGIDPEVSTRVFERFYTDRTNTGKDELGQNSGLGLSISKQIIDAHLGTIEALNWYGEDETTPAGARFIITLPVVD
ncbi:MAG: HAMP domain-containing histidine kinase, partial [Rhizobiales bacterium]|nr:HAMP domain-containing histidine kinase [Hyphomicrobiales bacterium]